MPTLTQRIADAWRSFLRIPFPGWGGRGGGSGGVGGGWRGGYPWGTLPGTQHDYIREVGDPALNSAVSICLNWIADQFPEPEFQVATRRQTKEWTPVPNHPLVKLINEPNGYYDGDALWASTITDYNISGDAYWLKVFGMGGLGRPVELWHLPWWMVEPRWDSEGREFISHYAYRVEGKEYRLERREVVHFRFKTDPYTRKGVSRLVPVLREVFADNEAATYTAAILRNMGIPGCIINPKFPERDEFNKESRDEFETAWSSRFTGDGRGKPLMPSMPVEVEPLGLSPEELVLKEIRTIPTERICAALRLHPGVVGLTNGQGPTAFDNGGQHRAGREAAYEDCIIPLQRRCARILDRDLLPDFEGTALQNRSCRWDYSGVRALQEDADAVAKRWILILSNGGCTLNEAKAALQLKPEPKGEVYYLPAKTRVVKADELDEPPELPGGDDDAGATGADDSRNGTAAGRALSLV